MQNILCATELYFSFYIRSFLTEACLCHFTVSRISLLVSGQIQSYKISARCHLQPMRTVSRLNKMKKLPSKAALLLILLLNVFSGDALTCHQSEYQIGNECCPMCPPGNRVRTDCTEFRSTSCLQCSNGTYMNQPTGRRSCFPCTTCAAVSGLKTKTSCTTKSDTVCEALQGFFCLDRTKDGCRAAQKHKSCQPGQYISQNGTADTDTVCSDCSDGTFSDGTLTSCLPHTQCESPKLLMKAGTSSADAECEEESSNSTGAVIGAVAVFILITGAVVFVFIKRKKIIPGREIKAKKHKEGGGAGANMMEVRRLQQRDDALPDHVVRIHI